MTGRVAHTRMVFLGFLIVAVVGPWMLARAHAQCTKDTDCKGSRICSAGACIDAPEPTVAPSQSVPPPPPPTVVSPPGYAVPPSYAAPPGYAPQPAQPAFPQPAVPPYLPPPAPPVQAPADPGWASGAGTYGIISGAISLGLALGSEATKDETVPSAPLGGAATLLFGISLPIVAAGGSSARGNPEVRGLPGLRIAG